MNLELENPFAVTKATEFSDTEIFKQWVDFSDNNSTLNSILNPREQMPKFILGSKGCGKTHLLRYYSYPIQKLKWINLSEVIANDQYIGIYAVFGGINSSRFSRKGLREEQWEKIFEYYLELYLASKLLDTIQDIIKNLEIPSYKLKDVFSNINNTILKKTSDYEFETIEGIVAYLTDARNNIDYIVNNSALTRNINLTTLQINFNPGDLIFGIPKLFSKSIDEFKNLKFIYILDELEKFSESQKMYINTLVWDKQYPCTFWIGARNYGYTTNKTKTQEELRQGSEFELVKLDEIIRSNEHQYSKFAKLLCYKRITKHILKKNLKNDIDNLSKVLDDFFECHDEIDLIKLITVNYLKKDLPHVEKLHKKLVDGFNRGLTPGVKKNEEIEDIIKRLRYSENPILEKLKFFFFYKLWSDNKNLINSSIEVNEEFSNHLKGRKSKFDNLLEKYRKDIIAQLLFETGNKAVYFSGIEDLIDISWGNPRSFLVILKKIYQWSLFYGEKPFREGLISTKAQNEGIFDASKWFYEDAEVIGSEGKNLYTCIANLAEYFKGIRYSDKPSEISVVAFFIKNNNITDTTNRFIRLAVDHSFIIKIPDGRKDKNSDRVDNLYQINKMLAPLYRLPTARRGTINLNFDLAESIFNPEKHREFNQIYREAIGKMTAPEFGKKNKTISNYTGDLFENDI